MKAAYGALANDMHAVYCAFAELDGWVWVKVGISVRPAQRARAIQATCPFNIKRFVFCHIGAMSAARSFEKRMAHALHEFSTRGEWFRFRPGDSERFRECARVSFRESSWRRAELKWSTLPYAEYHLNPLFQKDS